MFIYQIDSLYYKRTSLEDTHECRVKTELLNQMDGAGTWNLNPDPRRRLDKETRSLIYIKNTGQNHSILASKIFRHLQKDRTFFDLNE